MVDRDEAGSLLDDVAGVESRVRSYFLYSRIGDQMILWGVIWMLGYGGGHWLAQLTGGTWNGRLWLVLNLVGAIATMTIVMRAKRNARGRMPGLDVRPLLAVFAVAAFGMLWSHLAHFSWREQAAFYPTLAGFAAFVVGLWAGRALTILGVALFVLTVAGYVLAGGWLDVWLAALGGLVLIGGGFWLRR